jgi:hypothetical protein
LACTQQESGWVAFILKSKFHMNTPFYKIQSSMYDRAPSIIENKKKNQGRFLFQGVWNQGFSTLFCCGVHIATEHNRPEPHSRSNTGTHTLL